jgi:hypothetical protein
MLAAAGLVAVLWPFPPAQVRTSHYVLPTWGFSQSRDRFTGETRCRLYQGAASSAKVTYADHALTFHFARRINTLDADFRIDGGPVHRWQDEFPALVRVGAPLQNTSMTNPTGGLVTLPVDELKGAHTVAIRSTPKSRPELFTIDGFADAISAAEARGCPDGGFVS